MLTVGVVEVLELVELFEFPDVPVPLALVPVFVSAAVGHYIVHIVRL